MTAPPYTPLGFDYLLGEPTELRETHLSVYYKIQDTIKDTDEETLRTRSGQVPHGVGVCPFQACRCVHQPRSSLNPTLLRFLWRLYHIDMINY